MLKKGKGTGERQKDSSRGWTDARQADLLEVGAVPHRTCEWRAERGEDVLLDDDPAVVSSRYELAQERREIHAASAELAEHTMAQRRLVVPLFLSCGLGNRRLAILEVHVPDAVSIAREQLERRRPAIGRVAGVEAQADQPRIAALQKRIDFIGRLDITGAVVMEDRPQPRLVAHGSRNPFDAC